MDSGPRFTEPACSPTLAVMPGGWRWPQPPPQARTYPHRKERPDPSAPPRHRPALTGSERPHPRPPQALTCSHWKPMLQTLSPTPGATCSPEVNAQTRPPPQARTCLSQETTLRPSPTPGVDLLSQKRMRPEAWRPRRETWRHAVPGRRQVTHEAREASDHLAVGLPIQVGCLDVAQPVGVAWRTAARCPRGWSHCSEAHGLPRRISFQNRFTTAPPSLAKTRLLTWLAAAD